jgi:MYXO-CTERM domain-containing protein
VADDTVDLAAALDEARTQSADAAAEAGSTNELAVDTVAATETLAVSPWWMTGGILVAAVALVALGALLLLRRRHA